MNDPSPSWALESLPEIEQWVARRKPAFFLDFDGTIAPIVSQPELAVAPTETKKMLASVAQSYPLCFVSGRGLEDLRRKIDITAAYYAGDHGHRIVGPPHSGVELEIGTEVQLAVKTAAAELSQRLSQVEGVFVEAKTLSLSVHYRLVAEREQALVHRIVAEVASTVPSLRLTAGKQVHELRPEGVWGKGRAMLWLLERLGLNRGNTCPICLGDDLTDEEMFNAAAGWGVCVLVGDPRRPTGARYWLRSYSEVTTLIGSIVACDGRIPGSPD